MRPTLDWHRIATDSVLQALETSMRGLNNSEVAARLLQYGPNQLSGSGLRSPWKILWDQLTAFMTVVLVVAAAVSALLADYKDAAAIGAIVVLNVILGFSQEYRAERAMAALKRLSVPNSRVRRGDVVREVSSLDLVPGDIAFLEAGNCVAADGRIVEAVDLRMHESALTGESEPVQKTDQLIDLPALPVGDRRNMVYRGTFVTAGRGTIVVTDTGMRTELGRIAAMIQTVEQESTPLQRRLQKLGKELAVAALSVVAVIFSLGMLRGEALKLMLLTAVSIGVAAVPEGLPAVVTIALTLGAQRLLKRKVLVRRLASVETLGSVTVICSDKTGTLTENRMTATILHADDQTFDVDRLANPPPAAIQLLLAGGTLCNDAVPQDGREALGDPTEVALVGVASKFGIDKQEWEQRLPRIGEIPFDAGRKRMTTFHRVERAQELPPVMQNLLPQTGAAGIAFAKGAVDSLATVATHVWRGGCRAPMDPAMRAGMERANEALATKGMRVLGVAFRTFFSAAGQMNTTHESDMTFLGMVGIIDPPRREAAASVATCQSAGIKAVMITGDHPLTARFISRRLGFGDSSPAVTGSQLEQMSTADIERTAEFTSVYARVSPEHKLRIVEGLQRRGQIVAMTGDGVNDAPALKRADIGIAMGVIGTDVAKEAADMVLLDDNFATIVAAVEEGRVIYDNVRKFIRYILATNSGEIWLMLAAPLLGMPLPLLPLQILWLNLVTDGLPALALGVEPAEENVMQRPPYSPQESIFARGLGWHVIWVGILMCALSLGIGFHYWKSGDPGWQTMLFSTLTFSQMAHVLAIRSERRSLFQLGFFSNKPLLAAVMLTLALQFALIYVPALQAVFHTVSLPPFDLAVCLAASLTLFGAVEFEKWMAARPRSQSDQNRNNT